MKRPLLLFLLFIPAPTFAQSTESKLKVSANGHFLMVKSDGSPFFWLGDTGWGIFQFIPREEAVAYLDDRKAKGFNGFLGSLVFHFGNNPNFYGEKPWHDDPLQPNEAYFKNVDFILNQAIERDLYVGLLPAWGDKVVAPSGLLNDKTAYRYGHFLGKRYQRQNAHIIWVIGGDKNPNSEPHKVAYRRIAEGIADGINGADREDGLADYSTTLMTFHPQPKGHGGGSSAYFHQDEWLDFNMLQTSHHKRNNPLSYLEIAADYARTPAKPTLDAEPPYEDHGVSWNLVDNGYFTDHDVRKAAYWSVLAGAAGHIYGSHTVWQFASPSNPFDSFASSSRGWWRESKDGLPAAKDLPGASQMQYLKNLLLSRPYLSRIPDQDLVDEPKARTADGAPPGVETLDVAASRAEGEHVQAARDSAGHYAFVYFPQSKISRAVKVSRLSGQTIRAWWFSPRDGKTYDAQKKITTEPFLTFDKADRTFSPPGNIASEDWVLVLDDTAAAFAAPGQREK